MQINSRYPHFYESILDQTQDHHAMDLHVCIDTKKQTYLMEHVFGENCFVPATMIIELLFEASFYFCEYQLKTDMEEMKPYKLHDLSIMRGLTLSPGKKMDLHIKVIYKGMIDDIYEMELLIYSNRFNRAGEILGIRNNVTAKVFLRKGQCINVLMNLPQFEEDVFHLPVNEMYKILFPSLGYHFQTCQSTFLFDRRRRFCIGEFNIKNKEASCIERIESTFITSPIGNDACLQIAVLFSRMINLIGRLPIGGEEIEIIRKIPMDGNVKVLVECLEINDDMHCNITSYDDDGVYVRMKNFIVRKSPYHKSMQREKLDQWMDQYKVL